MKRKDSIVEGIMVRKGTSVLLLTALAGLLFMQGCETLDRLTQILMSLKRLQFKLLIDGKPTVYGNIERPIEIPGTGEVSTVPVRMSIDLYEFFGGQGYEEIIGLALALGGKRRDVSRVSLDAQPRVSTPFGEITYPGRITIIDKEFRY